MPLFRLIPVVLQVNQRCRQVLLQPPRQVLRQPPRQNPQQVFRQLTIQVTKTLGTSQLMLQIKMRFLQNIMKNLFLNTQILPLG